SVSHHRMNEIPALLAHTKEHLMRETAPRLCVSAIHLYVHRVASPLHHVIRHTRKNGNEVPVFIRIEADTHAKPDPVITDTLHHLYGQGRRVARFRNQRAEV